MQLENKGQLIAYFTRKDRKKVNPSIAIGNCCIFFKLMLFSRAGFLSLSDVI